MRILIADDHPIFRKGLLKVLEADASFEVAAETGDGVEALRLIENLKPEIAVLDISMPGMSGLEIIKAAQEKNLAVEFIVLTMYKEEEYFNEAMDLEVKGYILKECAVTDLLEGLKRVASGKPYVSPIISEYLINRNARLAALIAQKPALQNLTTTEKRILKLIAGNKTSREIARQLHTSYRTVQNHRANICAKLGLKGYNKLLQFALEHKSEL